MDKKHVVTQANGLIEARHNNPLTNQEQKIILTMVSMIEPHDKDFKDYRISIKEFTEMLELKGSPKYSETKAVTKQLLAKTVEIPQEDGGWLLTHWISSARYIKGEGVLALKFSPDLKPYLFQLKTHFTSYQLKYILSLNSTYAIRLYELMKRWQYTGSCESSVDDLRVQLGVASGALKTYGHFKAKALNKAITEVNQKTDLIIEMREIKHSRKIERIHFAIGKKRVPPGQGKKLERKPEVSEQELLRLRLNQRADGYQFDTTFFTQLHQAASLIWGESNTTEQELNWLIDYVNAETSIKNPLGFIKSKIKSAWEIHDVGQPITFADLRPVVERRSGRQEQLPDWLKSNDQPTEAPAPNPQLDAEKAQVLKKLAANKQRIADAKKKN